MSDDYMSGREPPRDHVHDETLEPGRAAPSSLTSRETWIRFVFMLILALLLAVAWMVGSVVVLLQFGWVLFYGEPKPELKRVGSQIAAWSAEVIEYLTYCRNERPFPFDKEWPA